MGKLYRSREGQATAVDTKTQLTTMGSETAPGGLFVPEGKSKISSIIVAAEADYAADGEVSAIIRLEGSGLPEGPETFTVGGFGNDVTTGARTANVAKVIDGLDIQVTPGNEILLFGEMAGTDIGQVSFGVTLVFE